MTFLLQNFWFWLLGALLVGVATGWLTRAREADGSLSGWLVACSTALVAGGLAALLQILPGRAGLWLETALATIVFFLLGACIGALARGGKLSEHKNWVLGLIPAALVWFAGNLVGAPALEANLETAVGDVVRNANSSASFSVEGRDVSLPKGVAERQTLAAAISKVNGVRLVMTPGDEARDRIAAGVADAARDIGKDAAEAGKEAAEAGKEAVEAGKEAVEKTKDAASEAVAEVKQAIDNRSAADKAREKLDQLPASGALDAASCETALNATVTVEKIQFRSGRATIERGSEALIARLAALLRRCPESKVEIAGHTDNSGSEAANRRLSQRRAETVAQALRKDGVAAARLQATGYGPTKPVAPNDTDEGRAENRRIEFTLK